MKTLLAIFLFVPVLAFSQLKDYRFGRWKAAGTASSLIGGSVLAFNHAYHADPYLFERQFGAKPTGFAGSDAWLRNYRNNDPEQGRKWGVNIHRDIWHASSAGSTFFRITGANMFSVKNENRHWTHYVLDEVIMLAAAGIGSHITYEILR